MKNKKKAYKSYKTTQKEKNRKKSEKIVAIGLLTKLIKSKNTVI